MKLDSEAAGATPRRGKKRVGTPWARTWVLTPSEFACFLVTSNLFAVPIPEGVMDTTANDVARRGRRRPLLYTLHDITMRTPDTKRERKQARIVFIKARFLHATTPPRVGDWIAVFKDDGSCRKYRLCDKLPAPVIWYAHDLQALIGKGYELEPVHSLQEAEVRECSAHLDGVVFNPAVRPQAGHLLVVVTSDGESVRFFRLAGVPGKRSRRDFPRQANLPRWI